MTAAEKRVTRNVDDPSMLGVYLKAALPVLPGASMLPGVGKPGGALPDLVLTRHDVPVDRRHVAAYAAVCGFGLRETVPVTYPHLLAFPLHMRLMTDGTFPFPAVGLVHVENSITQHRAISASESLQLTVSAAGLRPHPKGRVFDIVTTVHSAGELVWQETSTMLRRGREPGSDRLGQRGDGPDRRGDRLEEIRPAGIEWRLRGDLGRRYAAVSGDRNPIHLYKITAKAFGFPRQIAHGMWSKARCLAALEGRLPDAVTVDVSFKKPILLPGTVAFGSGSTPRDAESAVGQRDYAFSLTSPKSGAPHLWGRVTAG